MEKLTEEQMIALRQDYELAAASLRGSYLQRCTELEWYMQVYIAQCFTNNDDKIDELVTTILAPRVTFDNTFQIFKYLINKYHPDFETKYPKYKKEIQAIIEHRNILAHSPANPGDDAVLEYLNSRTIQFFKFKNIMNAEKVNLMHNVIYNSPKIELLINLMYDYIEGIEAIRAYREKPSP